MKSKETTAGLLVSSKEFPDIVWGKVIYKATGGHILVESFAQGTRHFINASKFVEFPVVIEPDNGKYHAYAPKFKGVHTEGETIEEAKRNVEDAIRAYLLSMLKHGEIRFNGNTRRYERATGSKEMSRQEALERELEEAVARKRIAELMLIHLQVVIARLDRKLDREEWELFYDYLTDELYSVRGEKRGRK